jgi:hypothetical protein
MQGKWGKTGSIFIFWAAFGKFADFVQFGMIILNKAT